MKTNKLSRTTMSFLDKIDSPFDFKKEVKNITDLIMSLPGVKLKEGYVIECLLPDNEGLGGESILFAREKNVPRCSFEEITEAFGYDILMPPEGHAYLMDVLSFEDTEEGVWSAFLVAECWRFLPLWWHAQYASQRWVLDADNLLNILPISLEEIESSKTEPEENLDEDREYGFFNKRSLLKVPALIGDESLLPSVDRNDDSTWTLKYVYFSDWGGLIQSEIKVKCNDGNVTFIDSDGGRKVLISYDCGICY